MAKPGNRISLGQNLIYYAPMKNWLHIALGTAALIVAPALLHARPPQKQQDQVESSHLDQTPLSAQELQALVSRAIENQHRNDAALDSFERIEQHISHSGSSTGPVVDDKTFRIVPTGSGTLRLLLRQNGKPVPESVYRRQLRDWENILQVAVHPDDPRQIAVLAKQKKKQKDRARVIDAAQKAFEIRWLAREQRDGHVAEKLLFVPSPAYAARGDSTDWLTHARATVWIGAQDAEVVSIEATITRDISFGGGVLGKIYRGGHFLMEQAPAAPGIWEPTLYEYDISGRKFLFSFNLHEVTTDSHFQLLGSPSELLAEARDNLAHCCSFSFDP